MATSATDFKHPYYEALNKSRTFEEGVAFFTGENSKRMNHLSLGEALDFISFGGMNYVVWNFGVKDMVKYIKTWMNNQEPRRQYKKVDISESGNSYRMEETSREYSYTWNRFPSDFDEELPFINLNECPRDKEHKGTMQVGAKVRCAHKEVKMLKPGFVQEYEGMVDRHSGFKRASFEQTKPSLDNGIPIDAIEFDRLVDEDYRQEFERNRAALDQFHREESTAEIIDPCYSILSDKGQYLPLETVLKRLECSHAFIMRGDGHTQSIFPFSGFTVASFVKAWHNQPGRKIMYEKPGKRDTYRLYSDFQPVSSDD